jgi:hypothetical protein
LYNSVTKKPREVYVAYSRDLVSWKSPSSLPLLASQGYSFQLGYMKYCAWPLKLGESFLVFSAVSNKRYSKSALGLWRTRNLLGTEKPEFLGYITRQRPGWSEKEVDTPFVVNNQDTGKILCYFGGRSRHRRWTEGIAYTQCSEMESYLPQTRVEKDGVASRS